MSQDVPCYLTSTSASIFRSLRSIVLPWHGATPRIHKRNQKLLVAGKSSREQGRSTSLEEDFFQLNQFGRVRRQVGTSAATETLDVSVSFAISSSASAPSSDPLSASSSSGGSTTPSVPANAPPSNTGAAPVVSNTVAPTVTSTSVTPETVKLAQSSNAVSTLSSVADPPSTPSTPQPTSTSQSPTPSSKRDTPSATVSSAPVTTSVAGSLPAPTTPQSSFTTQSPASSSKGNTPSATVSSAPETTSTAGSPSPSTPQPTSTPRSPASSSKRDTPSATVSSAPDTTTMADPPPTLSTSQPSATSQSLASSSMSDAPSSTVFPVADPTSGPPSTLQPSSTSQPPATSSKRDTPSPTTSVFPSSISPSSTAPASSTSTSSSVDPSGSSAPALPPETTTTPAKTSTQPISTVPDPVTTTQSSVVTSTISNTFPTTSSSTLDPTDPTTSVSAASPPSSSPPTSLIPSSTSQTSSYTPSPVYQTSLSVSTLESPTITFSFTQVTTFTTIFTTTLSNGRTTTVSTVVETGVLSTNIPKPSSFTRHTGAIIGVALSATLAILLIVVLIIFACKRYKARRRTDGSMEDILAMAREVWRPPLDGDDDDSYLAGYHQPHSQSHHRAPGSQGHHAGGAYDGLGGVSASVGEVERGRHGNAESGNARMINSTYGGQPGFEQSLQGAYTRPVPTTIPGYGPTEDPETAQVWWGTNDPQAVSDETRQPVDGGHPISGPGSHSAASLTMVGGSSSGGHGGGSSGEHHLRTTTKRNSLPGTRPMLGRQTPRHSFTPPSASANMRDPTFDHERQSEEQTDKNSVRGFLSRLRNGRRMSAQSVATVRAPSQPRGSHESDAFSAAPNLYSPSLLNPPMAMPPPNNPLRFPNGVTGNGHAPPPPKNSNEDSGFDAYPSGGLWTPVTLPRPPSPVPTDNSSMVEGLLHPRLGMKLGPSRQASTRSLRDNEDYTRPINGLVNNHLRSTTTFETQDPIGL